MIINNLQHIQPKEYMPGFWGKPIHGKNMTQVYWEIKKDAHLPEHYHVHEQTINMISGEFELTVLGDTKILRKGDVVVLHSNVPHSGRALTDCEILDVFSPVREMFQ